MDDPWATVEAAAGDRSAGAAEIAARAAEALGRLPDERVLPALESLLRAHPSMAPLWRLATEVLSSPDRGAAARWFGSLLQGDRRGVNALAPRVSRSRVVTISYSSSILELVRQATPSAVICMRSEPGGEGVAAAEAMADWTHATVIEDDDAIERVPADAVIVGADAVTPQSVVNKVKTRALAEAARAKGIPTYVLAGAFKYIGDELPAAAPFEAAPLELFSAIAGPSFWAPEEAASEARRRRVHSGLRPLLDELLKSATKPGRAPRPRTPSESP